MRIKDRPWKLLAGAIVLLIGLIGFGMDLTDGSIELRRHGMIDAEEHPVRFAMVCFMYALGWVLWLVCCVAVFDEWQMNYSPPPKDRFIDPDRVRSHRPSLWRRGRDQTKL
ncbi:hypothetical protein NYR55_06235 [Sphingomonas sp. BGYR3]|uniref:hypothetical protein n=1 Tax=Sphingomonas sp. BGYR3 TaxID=2975483 RepID=UPI0021A882C5|nr:hypothetical protein [Sphingomonas sp. BGYR3]MDG5488217.1 hypothetical protein [Sphingomonas sp. BGYR3]